ncbi:hypothetical protein E4U53_002791 [Claviceps sorghi]|nr:hypothetical protein E4U53_002791 [Claviceps sorghi]
MFSIKNLVFLAVAVSGTVIQRAKPEEPKYLELLVKDIQTVTAAAKAYNGGGLAKIEPINKAVNTYIADVKTTVKEINTKGPFSEPVTVKIINYAKADFLPTTNKAYAELKAKKPLFKAGGVVPRIATNLKSSGKVTVELIDALLAHAPANKKDQIKELRKQYVASYDKIVKDFS